MEKGKTVKPVNDAVPIFLRKTYHMIDTCDSKVACWSQDGETFIVKNTDVFEKSIIPQFFKHSKFSSFVRQLNFYGFRKIKYADTIKIDAKLEAETANFWRFRHEKFIRGKPELLIDIKRSNGHQAAAAKLSTTVVTPMAVLSSSALPKEDGGALKSEVTCLKERIEAMTKNIDQLTSMVQKVTLKQEEQETKEDVPVEIGAKRKKLEAVPESKVRLSIRPDAAVSAMDLDDDFGGVLDNVSLPPLPPAQVGSRQTSDSDSSKLTDNDFVDHMFTAFGEEDNLDGLLNEVSTIDSTQEDENTPDPRLMQRLSEALKMLPKEMQEMIVDRLVANIVGTDSMEKNVKAASALTAAMPNKIGRKFAPNQVPQSPVLNALPTTPQELKLPMPLAAATLAALLTQYSEAVKDKTDVLTKEKTLPRAIPIHA
eukprot:CAMPEP_0119007020 /NCGR_PEP_ID=MMETSP1176-20130426/2710_1 /TAXON_ID=265551 /ORGANISM="Synedropsis recta cf, Strain CCMP1620" /LENGTH=425 /DNA_ID=CAMNT_0006959075 /DNA_START=156 /DNA_END=1433 /DNA_ORIENTATION=+